MATGLRFGIGAVALSALIVGVATTLGSIVVTETERTFVRQVESDLHAELATVADTVGGRLGVLAALARATAAHMSGLAEIDGAEAAVRFQDLVSEIRRQVPALRTILLIDRTGTVVDDMRDGKPGVGFDVSDQAYVRAHVASAHLEVLVHEPVLRRLDTTWTWVMSTAIRRDDGSLVAVIAFSLDRRFFANVIDDQRKTAGLSFLMVHGGRRILEASGRAAGFVGAAVPAVTCPQRSAAAVASRVVAVPWHAERERVLCYRLARWPVAVATAIGDDYVRNQSSIYGRHVRVWVGAAVIGVIIILHLVVLVAWQTVKWHRADVDRRRSEIESKMKSQFIASVSHDLRTPLSAIIGYSELLRESERDGARRRNLEVIFRSGQRLSELINDMIDLSRIEAGRFPLEGELFSVASEIDEIAFLVGDRITEKGLTLAIDCRLGGEGAVIGDARAYRRILTNLVENAIKYTETGGITITVTATASVADASATLISTTVADTGIGIAEADHDRVFEPFARAGDGEAGGAPGVGLGLAICRRLAGLMGGEIRLVSAPGAGAVFTFTFSCRFAAAVAASAVPDRRGRTAVTVDAAEAAA